MKRSNNPYSTKNFRRGMECLNLRFVRIGSKNTIRTARTPHRAITAEEVCLHSVKWADQYQIGSNGSINNYHFTNELVLTEGEILQYVLLLVAFNKILEYLQQRVLRPFTVILVIFHARVWANLWSSKLLRENSAVKHCSISNHI